MGTVNVTLGDGKKLNLVLGQQLENAVTAVVFDFSAWKTEFGSGTLGLSVQRHGDDQPYAVVPTVSGNNATWNITELDTAYKGVGEVQVTYTVGSVVKKSTVYKFTVYRSLGENGEYPSPGQTWQEEIEDELADVKQDLAHITSSAVPTTVRQAIKTLFETGAYADTGLTDEMAVISSWASEVTAISLNKSSTSITGSGTEQLVATTTPTGGTVTWSSSDTSVATVSSNGLVTGVGNGTATITATCGGLSATCAVAVSGFATLTSISAVYTQSGTVNVYDNLDTLKNDLVVTAYYDDTTTATVPSADYTLSGTLEVGTSVITVTYEGKTTTFNVIVSSYPTDYTWLYKSSDGQLLSARTDLVTASMSTGCTETLSNENLNLVVPESKQSSLNIRYDLTDTTTTNGKLSAKVRFNGLGLSSSSKAYGFRLQLSNGTNGIMFYEWYNGTNLKLLTYSGNTLTELLNLDFDTWYIIEIEANNGTYTIKLNGQTVYTSTTPATYYCTANRIQIQNQGGAHTVDTSYSNSVDVAWIAYKSND